MNMWFDINTWLPILPEMLGVGVLASLIYFLARQALSKKEHKKTTPEDKLKTTEQPPTDVKKALPRKELKDALLNTRSQLFGRIKNVFKDSVGDEEEDFEALERILYTSDLGPNTVQKLVEGVGKKLSTSDKKDFEKVRLALKQEMLDIFSEVSEGENPNQEISLLNQVHSENDPMVWMIVGVNGAGKTTTIGKLAHAVVKKGFKVMIVAGDTFRAAASDQLQIWSERANVEIFSPKGVTDPSAVIFDGCQKAKAQAYDLVIVDTAGRLHTQANLMDELKKMKRVMQKILPNAPSETLIVLDSNSGQNALIQTEKFNQAIGLTGVVITKLDGSGKGGVAVGLAYQFHLPIKMIGVGESIDDLRGFSSKQFVDSIM